MSKRHGLAMINIFDDNAAINNDAPEAYRGMDRVEARKQIVADMDKLALATRLISREMDHQDPMPGKYTLEVTTPGVERTLRLPYHFQRQVGKTINVRLADVEAEQRRFEGELTSADDTTATVRIGEGDDAVERVVEIADIDRARTVFVWGPQPKKGGKGAPKKKPNQSKPNQSKKESP